MSAAPEQLLETIVRAGDVESCLAFFADMPENERRKLAPLARQVLREGEGDDELFAPCERVALLATASLTEVRRFRHKVLPGWLEDDFEPERRVLENRRPAWLQSWCKWTLEKGYRGWPLVRALVRNGACPPPETDMYVLGMIRGVCANSRNWSVLAGLRDDPELLDNEVWRLFEIEGRDDVTLHAAGEGAFLLGRGNQGWSRALRELSDEGRLDRNRLLDASLATLNRDFAPYHAQWFWQFHEDMQPTVEERAARTAQYLDLLASPTSPIVSVAMRALVTIQKSGRLDNAAFVARVEPVLYAATKTPPMQALKILADIANADPGLVARAVELAVVGLEHKHSDVQAAALDIIETHGDHGDDGLRAAVEERAALMEAAMRVRTAQWLPTVDIKSVDTEFDDLDELLRRARTLSEEIANRSGVATVTAEIENLSGAMPAIYDDTLALITRRITTSRDPRRFLWPGGSSFLARIVCRCLTAKRRMYASIPFWKTRSSLRRIDRSMNDRYWSMRRPCNPHSGNVWLLFEMLTRLDHLRDSIKGNTPSRMFHLHGTTRKPPTSY